MRVLSHAAIVKAIRDGLANEVDALVGLFSERERPFEYYGTFMTHAAELKYAIERMTAELVEGGVLGRETNRLVFSPQCSAMARALRLSFSGMDDVAQPGSMVVSPYFGLPHAGRDLVDVFVVMSFEKALEPVYTDHIAAVVARCGLKVARADNFFTARHVIEDVWGAIASSRAIIADCTGRNPNVFYEIGIAHTVGKPVILITQHEDDVPFDLRATRFIRYSYTPRGMAEFENSLKMTLSAVLGVAT
jgi:hypothetical protein